MSSMLLKHSRPASVVCRAEKGGSKSIRAAPKAAKASKPAKAGAEPTSKTSLSILKAVEELQLLSQVEKLGLLSKAEKAGFSLSKIEESGLLSAAEKSGVLSLIADKNTPGLLNGAGVAALGAAVALVLAVPDDTTASLVGQGLGGALFAGVGFAALTGGSVLDKFQKL
ncbi:hypothetical protein DUNSADRAFT_3691 [Dunaliella salina]|uniref:Uncharacterized protein n=1 Tax=Dunaliella salina TaxID=3046 RepID=A0ABQ7GTI5_DUNSA|nr:hypothetical protein DUNSADRAFT_3691 [Dunaliella salina]|eukprot:KAF5837914.1 hypothetical protein DUNSADRAFT_3691 [Dunaliella salina]